MLRIRVFTVLTETDSSLAISGRERLAGRNHSRLRPTCTFEHTEPIIASTGRITKIR